MTQAEPDGLMASSEARSVAASVSAFAQHPGAVVEVVHRGTPRWKKYARLAEVQYRVTGKMFDLAGKGLPTASRHASPVWRSRRAAERALSRSSTPDYAVVAAVGDTGVFTVATVIRVGQDMVVVGAGTTHPGAGDSGASHADVPSVDQVGDTVWYALNYLAATERRSLVNGLPASSWRGAGMRLDRSYGISRDGTLSERATTTQTTPEAVRQLSKAATGLLLRGQNPFPELDIAPGMASHRARAVLIDDFIRGGGTVGVHEHRDPMEAHRLPGARTLIATIDGELQATLSVGMSADGSIKELDSASGGLSGAMEALRLVTYVESTRSGASARGRSGPKEPAFCADAVAGARSVLGDRMDLLPTLGWDNAGSATTSLEEVAAAVDEFRKTGGSVRVLSHDHPAFGELRDKLAPAIAEELAGIPRTHDGLGSVWQAFDSPGPDGYPDGTYAVGAFDRYGEPLVVAAIRDTGHRLVLGAVGHVAGANPSAVTAALVDGVYRAAGTRPVAGYLPEAMAAAYGKAGARVGGPAAADAPFLTAVNLNASEPAQIAEEVDRQVSGPGPADLRGFADHLRDFQVRQGTLSVFDHSTESGQRDAAGVVAAIRYATGRAGEAGQGPAVPGRITVAAYQRGAPRAYLTFDTTDGVYREKDSGVMGNDASAEAAICYGTSHCVVSRQLTVAEPASSDEPRWDARKSLYLLTGLKRYLGDHPQHMFKAAKQLGDVARRHAVDRRLGGPHTER